MIEDFIKPQPLSYFCQKTSSLRTKLALLTFYKVRFPPWTEKALLIFEYLQLVSQALITPAWVYGNLKDKGFYCQVIMYALKLVNPSNLLDYEDSNSLASTILMMILTCILLKLALFAYVLYASVKNGEINRWLLLLWRWIYKFQTRVLYLLFTSFWVKLMIEARERGFDPFGEAGKTLIFFISIVMITLEFVFTLVLETQLCYFLPSKDFLCSKNNSLQMITFLQRFIIQLFAMSIKSDSKALAWIVPIFSFIMDLCRLSKFFGTLPLYSTNALLLQGSLICTVYSANLAQFVNMIIQTKESRVLSLKLVIVLWILFALLTNRLSYQILKRQIFALVNGNNRHLGDSPEILLHKAIAIKEQEKYETFPISKNSNYRFQHLQAKYQDKNLEDIFGLDLKDSLGVMNKVYLLYFQELSKRYPKNALIKLHWAYRSLKNSESYAKTIKIITEIQENQWAWQCLSCSLLLYEIEKSILDQTKNTMDEQTLDLSTYIESKTSIENLRLKMLEQTSLHLKVCHNVLNQTSNVGIIHKSAQKISTLKLDIQKSIDCLLIYLPENYISPLLTFAEYQLVVNHSRDCFEKLTQLYYQRDLKFQKFFKQSNLVQENLYQPSNASLLISSDSGKILYHNKQLAKLCGSQDIKFISSLFPISLKEYYEKLFLNIGEQEGFLNRIHKAYMYHKDGHLTEADFCLKYHPCLTQGLCLNMVIRPVPTLSNREFLLLTEDGNIEGASKELSKLLGLKHGVTSQSVKTVSKKLHRVNTAFNTIEKSKRESEYKKIQEIVSAFTSEDQEVQLYPLNQTEPEKFYAKFQVLTYGDLTMKKVSLRPVNKTKGIFSESSFGTKSNEKILDSPPKDYFPPTSIERRETTVYDFQETALTSPRETNADLPLIPPQTPKKIYRMGETKKFKGIDEVSVEEFGVKSVISNKRDQKPKDNQFFKIAIYKKSYPRSFTVLCLVFYFVILMTFVSQMVMKSVSDHTMNGLEIRNSILKYAQEKYYKGALIHINALGAIAVLKGIFATTGVNNNVSVIVVNLQDRIKDIKAANDGILRNIYALEKEVQDEFFAADIIMNGTLIDGIDESYRYLNTFQVTGEILNAGKTLLGLANSSDTVGYNIFEYLAYNLANDFLYREDKLSEILESSVEQQKNTFQNLTNLFLILNPFLLAGIGVLLILIIWNQYRINKKNMKAFIKIPHKEVKIIAKKLTKFQKNLLNQETLENKWTTTFEKLDHVSGNSRRSETQKVIYKKFRTRYYKYGARVFICILLLVTITICDLLITRKDIKIIYNRQDQLQFASRISNQVILAYAAVGAVYQSNNTVIMAHQPAIDTLAEQLAVIMKIQAEIPKKFLEVDGSYNTEVQEILFGNNAACVVGFPSNFANYCRYLVRVVGQRINIMVQLSGLHSLFLDKYQGYMTSNISSAEVLYDLRQADSSAVVANAITSSQQAQNIVDIMNESMMNKIAEMQESRRTIIIIFSISLFVVGFLIWIYILRVIREVYNDFKKVLQLFPPDLILSSYLLKQFLQQTSSNGFLFKSSSYYYH